MGAEIADGSRAADGLKHLKESHDKEVANRGATMRLAISIIVVVVFLPLFALSFFVLGGEMNPEAKRTVVNLHASAVFGVPIAALLSFAVVTLLRQADGPIEFEGLGFKVRGAAGQVLMWVLCVLALAGAIKLLW